MKIKVMVNVLLDSIRLPLTLKIHPSFHNIYLSRTSMFLEHLTLLNIYPCGTSNFLYTVILALLTAFMWKIMPTCDILGLSCNNMGVKYQKRMFNQQLLIARS